MATLIQDLRYGLRMLAKSPGFTAVAVLSLALGIGGNAAMFSIVRAVLIAPLPYANPDRLVEAADSGYYPPGALVALEQQSKTMDVAGYSDPLNLNLTGYGETLRLTGYAVSANLFSVLGAEPELGRAFRKGEDHPGQDNLVILSHALWQSKFGADPGIIGRVIALNGVGRRVIGVMPPGFTFPNATTQFWVPLHLDPRDANAYWATNFMPVIARLRRGVSLRQAQREIRALTPRLISLFPYPMGHDWNAEATVLPLQQFLVQGVRAKLLVLQGAIGLVLLIACVNVASLLLARASARQNEMALRAALGARSGRIVRQLLTESVTLALVGGGLGVALALEGFSILKAAIPVTTPGWSEIHIGWQALVFVSALSVLTGLAFGVAPALSASKQDLASVIKSGGRRSSAGAGSRLRRGLIAGEVALAVVLAVSAGLLVKSLWLLAQVNPGFQPERILTLRVSPNPSLCRNRSACIALYSELLRRAQTVSGAYEVAAANTVPLSADVPYVSVAVEGQPYTPAERTAPLFWGGAVTPRYFRLMRIPILEGRAFADSDTERSAFVVIVSAATARRYWPGQNPIGKHVRVVWEDNWRTVVGVAADVRQYDLANHSPEYLSGAMYMPYAQSTDSLHQLPASMNLLVGTGSNPSLVAHQIREIVRDANPDAAVTDVRTMESLVKDSTGQSRSLTWLFMGFAGVALFLAAVGVYGVVSFSVARRKFEMGVRMALGATKVNIFGLVLRQSLRLVLVGLACGLVASLALARALSSFLYGVSAADAVTYIAVCALLIAVGTLAGLVPARRATKVDPMVALRYE